MRRLNAWGVFLWVAITYAITPLCAQEVATIHVSADRVQIPALVLGEHREEIAPIPKEQFRVTLDRREFPVNIRREGDDPLEVTVLVDSSDAKNALLPLLREAFSSLGTLNLKTGDHLSVFGMDGCKLRRFRSLDLVKEGSIGAAVGDAAEIPSAIHGSCPKRAGLWDVLWYLANSMQNLPGRRILLPITNGDASGSTRTASVVRQVANQYGVSLFPIAERGRLQGPLRGGDISFMDADSIVHLSTLSEFSGGIVSEAIPTNLPYTLAHVFQMVRGRYILEFPRPEGMFGTHKLNVSLRSTRAMVRSGGLEFPARQKHNTFEVTTDSLPELSLPEPEQSPNPPATTAAAQPDAATPAAVAPTAAAVTTPQTATLPIASKSTEVDLTDITGDLRSSH